MKYGFDFVEFSHLWQLSTLKYKALHCPYQQDRFHFMRIVVPRQ